MFEHGLLLPSRIEGAPYFEAMAAEIFIKRTRIARTAAEVFAWHERIGALERLSPPWEHVRILRHDRSIRPGARVEIETWMGPLRQRWLVEHRDYLAGVRFKDVQVRGPFAQWEHTHEVEPDGLEACWLVDTIRYRLPLGAPGRRLAGAWVREKLERIFRWRHAVTKADLESPDAAGPRLKVVVAGASGLIGRALEPVLQTQGHEVVRLVRRPVKPGSTTEIFWNPARGEMDASALDGVDAIINLSGTNIASGRWTARRRAEIMASRLDATHTLATAVAKLHRRPAVWLNASAVGIYGDRSEEVVTEASSAGRGFLADVVTAWESAAKAAAPADARLACLRFGVVLSPAGGALAKMRPAFRCGVGGPLGNGRQWMSWIAIDDAVGSIVHALRDARCAGALNVTAPEPVTNATFAAALAVALRRPAFCRVPAGVLRLAFGEMADEALLASTRALPEELVRAGYVFRFPRIENAVRHVLGSEA